MDLIDFQDIPAAEALTLSALCTALSAWRGYNALTVHQVFQLLVSAGHVRQPSSMGSGEGRPVPESEDVAVILIAIADNAERTGVRFERPRHYRIAEGFYTGEHARQGALTPAGMSPCSRSLPLVELGREAVEVYWVVARTFVGQVIEALPLPVTSFGS